MSSDTLVVSKNVKEYRCRKPQYSSYYQCIEDNYEMFERVYERKYQAKYGYLRPNKNSVSKKDTKPAAISSIQTFGEFLGFNPHLHMLCANGCFGVNGFFMQQALILMQAVLNHSLDKRYCPC